MNKGNEGNEAGNDVSVMECIKATQPNNGHKFKGGNGVNDGDGVMERAKVRKERS